MSGNLRALPGVQRPRYPTEPRPNARTAMPTRLARLLILLLLPLAAAAAPPSLAPEATSRPLPLVEQLLALDAGRIGVASRDDTDAVLPIWSGSDGSLLGVLALPRNWSDPLSSAPGHAGSSSWVLAGLSGSAAGLRWSESGGLHAEALLGQYLASLPAGCSDCGFEPEPGDRLLTAVLGMGWTQPEGSFDFSYGLSWLRTQDASVPLFAAPQAQVQSLARLPVLAVSRGGSLARDDTVFARGRWQLAESRTLSFGASLSRSQWVPLLPGGSRIDGIPVARSGLDINQLSLSLGLDVGSLRGAVIGHVMRSDDPLLGDRRWTAVDLGISWRTPWSGEISVGAQNLWSSPQNPREAVTDPVQRTPYVQYRQDL